MMDCRVKPGNDVTNRALSGEAIREVRNQRNQRNQMTFAGVNYRHRRGYWLLVLALMGVIIGAMGV
jgi:hypothetical protein